MANTETPSAREAPPTDAATSDAAAQNAAYYDVFAARYDRPRSRGYHAMLDDLEASLVKHHAAGRDALELGCGTGLLMERIAPATRRLVGIDISPRMAEQAAARGHEVVVGDLTELPFEDGTFDVVYSFKVLPHVVDLARALDEAARVTKPGGSLFLEFYNPRSLRYLAKRIAGPGVIGHDRGAPRTEADVYTRWHSPHEVRELLPSTLRLRRFHGVRVLTPMAAAHRVPVLGGVLRELESRAMSGVLAEFGGFLVAELERA